MLQRRSKITLLFALISVMLLGAPSALADLDLNLDLTTEDADLDSCSSTSGGLSTSLGCDSDEVIDFTTFSGELEGPDSAGYDDALTQNSNARDFIQTVVNYGLSFLGLFAVVMVIYGGVLYVLSRGDEDMATKGKKTIGYSAIGILIVLGSYAIVNTLINAGGGGGGGSDALGSGLDGTTISEAGANFDVEDVLTEIEAVATDYIAAYETLVEVKREIAYMESIELPYVLSLTVESTGTQGFSDKLDSALSGEGWDSSSSSDIYDVSGVNDFISEMTSSIQEIQRTSDNLSNAYYVATQIYSYLKSGTALPDDLLSTSSTASNLLALIFPEAKASDFVDSLSTQYSPGSCASLVGDVSIDSSDSTGLTSANEYTGSTEVLYEEICALITALDAAASEDFVDSVSLLADRIGSEDEGLLALFETDLSGASSLNTIVSRLQAARSSLEGSTTTLNVDTVQDVIASLDSAYTAIEQVQFVSVVMDVSATSGNAPLLVAFDVVGTEDPSGNSVGADDIEWDLDGDGTFNGSGDKTLNGGDAATGYSVSAIYNEEGSYRVRVRVKSNSEDGDVAAGIASTTINVDARRSKIVLKGISGGEETVIADFTAENKFEYIDKDTYRVTASEAESGIQFDASGSTDGNGESLSYIEWDFGDTEFLEGAWNGDNIAPIHYYTAGTYNLSLTVTDNTGAEDRKYFTLYVGSPASRVSYTPSTGNVGTTFKFDGSGSSTDVGSIVSYSWSITGDDGSVAIAENGKSTMSHTFESPGVYTVQLQVSDSSNNTDVASVSVLVESTPPVASFECEIQDASKPGTLTCDGSNSYDPDEDEISYLWDFDGEERTDFEYLEGDETSSEVTVRYLEADTYDISLKVTDDHEEDLQKSDTFEHSYTITSVLELTMEVSGDAARNLGPEGSVDVTISGETTGSSIEVDCGNTTSSFTDSLSSSGQANLTCTYSQAGIFNATMTAYDEEGHSTKDTKRVYIGSGDEPIAVIDVGGNGEDIEFDGDTVYGNVKTKFTFDASNSVNIDGSSDTLTYSWNFGNGKTSTSKSVTTTYDEVANYTVTLTVRDRTNNTIASETSVDVEISPIPPEINGLVVVPQGTTLETPLKVNVSIDASDDDGKITYVKAWYYDLNDTAEPLGTVIAQATEFSMTINTKGLEGEEVSYGFAVEVTDSDNLTVYSEDELSSEEIPTLTVVNGPNDSPEAHFSVDLTSLYIGEEITFVNESFDPDGSIVYSWWDIGADGTHNDERMDGADSLSYTFTQIHPEGVEVRLKVEDSSGATATSEPLTIYVDTLADPPDARFLADIQGTTVSFQNNSDVDEDNGVELQGVYWDFDLEDDTDGNGVPNDDFDSFDENPEWTYEALGVYQVMMTVVDTAGQIDTVTQDVNVLETEDPVAAFSYSVEEKQVIFKNESTVDSSNGVDVRAYAWDLDLDFDADGDGETDNDVDSTNKSPTVEYDDYGDYEVSLMVTDTYGKVDTANMTVEVADPVQPVEAMLTSIPQANSSKQIILSGTEGDITFFYNAEGGSGTFTYQFDKNIFYDTNNDGTRDNDIDHASEKSGTWTTTFFQSYGTTVVSLTVTDDETGEKDTETVQVVFEGSVGSANLINATPKEMMFLILSALLAVIGGVALVAFKPNLKT